MARILVIDDEPAICWSARALLTDRGHVVNIAASVEQSWSLLHDAEPDAIVLDIRLPGVDGISALPEFRQRLPQTPVIVMTAFGDLPNAVSAYQRGAFEYLLKPFDLDQFAELVERALAKRDRSVKMLEQGTEIARVAEVYPLVGTSAAMQSVYRQIALFAGTDFPVLITGPTGSGKELVARAIHEHSGAAAGPFVPVCLASLNPSLIESELFGHVRGAFTGATQDRGGMFAAADSGSLFFDELADTPLDFQVKLLRVLESRRYSPVGSGKEIQTRARVIAASNRRLDQLIREGRFREDLFHRLNVFCIELPSLEERREDIPELVAYFVENLPSGLRPRAISDQFWKALEQRKWSGNVRELRHVVEHAAVLARGDELDAAHLPQTARDSPSCDASSELEQAVIHWVDQELDAGRDRLHERLIEKTELALLRRVLAETDQNRSAAARLLGVDRATLRQRLRDEA
jgi:two-component system nitrogen regulation response regulator GlnG